MNGMNGMDGMDGTDGRDGRDGRDGTDEADGRDGRDWRDGTDGTAEMDFPSYSSSTSYCIGSVLVQVVKNRKISFYQRQTKKRLTLEYELNYMRMQY